MKGRTPPAPLSPVEQARKRDRAFFRLFPERPSFRRRYVAGEWDSDQTDDGNALAWTTVFSPLPGAYIRLFETEGNDGQVRIMTDGDTEALHQLAENVLRKSSGSTRGILTKIREVHP